MNGLRTVCFDVPDLAAARAFYAAFLRAAPTFDQPFYVGFDVAGYELGLRPAEGAQQPGVGGATAYLASDDVDGDLARLVELGARVREAPQEVGGGIIAASVVDVAGNVLGLLHNPHFAPPLTVIATPADLAPRALHHEVIVARRLDDVWRQWTTVEGLRFVVADARVELRPGGAYEWFFLLEKPPGLRGGEGCRVLSFLPGRMLSFTWNAPPDLPRTRRQYTWVVVTFDDVDDGARTRVTLDHLGWPAAGLRDDPQWEETFAYFDRAWPRVLTALASS